MTTIHDATLALHDGHSIPQLGFGVWRISDEQATQCVRTALDAGYRHIDTARIYENERGVGAGIRDSGVARDDVFVTTKLWNDAHGDVAAARAALEASLERLGMDRVDLYLVHWPCPDHDDYVQTWQSLVQLREQGLTRSVGVSNFTVDHLRRTIDESGEVPAINQVELHPYMQQRELRAFHAAHGIATQAWSPIGRGGELLDDPVIVGIAREHADAGATPAQVVLRWHVQHGFVTIPKSQTPSRIVENISIDGFELTADQLAAIDALDRGSSGRIGPDPDVAHF